MKGIYIHIPFCRKICNYCDFYKMVVSDNFKNEFVEYLIKDLNITSSKYSFSNVRTVYIGGGTPSCLPLETLEKLFISLSTKVDLEKLDEFTIEANPEDLTKNLVLLLKKYHVTRVSIGVQTFDIKNEAVLGRYTNYEDLKNKVEMLKECGINNFSLDLIYAIPNTTIKDLENDIDLMLSLHPSHISTYSLILEERTILYHKYLKEEVKLVDEDVDALMYDLIKTKLSLNGYKQYETSNFSLKGYESKHNLIYWNYDEYYGIGPAASSFISNSRITNVTNIKKYYSLLDENKLPFTSVEQIDSERLLEDYVMLGLRKTNGISLDDFTKRFNKDFFACFLKTNELISEGMLEYFDGFIKINEKYLYISNFIISKLLFD